jgi:hypothetical protein
MAKLVNKQNTQHVVPHPDGGWSVKKGGSIKATKIFERQNEAINFARRISINQSAKLYIHSRDGMVREKYSYNADPNPPIDK